MTEENIIERLIFYNPWWGEEKVAPSLSPPFKRNVFLKIKKYLSLERIILLKGPRRTGKSTLLYQLIDTLIKEGVKPKHILYLNFEDPLLRVNLHTLFTLYEKISLEELHSGQTRYVFLDEVHLLTEWASSVKAFFDKKYPLKFICSGSAASLLQKTSESLAGRTIEEVVLPFSFQEFADYHFLKQGVKNKITLKDYSLFKKKLEILWQKYLRRGGFAHLLEIEEVTLFRKLIYEDIVQKVIYKDLVDLYGIREPLVLEKVFYYLLSSSGQIFNLSNLGRIVGINRETLRRYLAYLQQAFLYFELLKFSRSVKERIGSAPKIHLIDPGLFHLSVPPDFSLIWETAIARHLWEKAGGNLFYWRNREEVDLVWQKEEVLIPVEIKTSVGAKQRLTGLIKFMRKFKIKKGYVISSFEEKEETIEGKRIIFLSASKLLYFQNQQEFLKMLD